MKRHRSIKRRLFFAALITTGLVLAVATIGLAYLFERHITRRVDADMVFAMQRIAAQVDTTPDINATAPISLREYGVWQRADIPYGGYYWQIAKDGKVAKTSRSLWDQIIPPPIDKAMPLGEGQFYTAPGPDNSTIRVLYRQLQIKQVDGSPAQIDIAIAVDKQAIIQPRQEFITDIIPSLALLALFLIAANVIYVVYGMRPLETIRREVNAIRSGDSRRFPDNVPSEVQPLSEEINALLDANDQALERARNRAADLAHGLKTPLTALTGDVRRLRDRDERAIADDIAEAVDIMSRHVAREMARARIRSAGTHTSRIPLTATLKPLIETLQRTPAGEKLDWHLSIADDVRIAMDRDDLVECMGNLLENATRYAKSAIWIGAVASATNLRLTIADDGPGLTDAQYQTIRERGQRLDESGGAGLGLAIVHEIVEAYGAVLTLDRSTYGGLRATLELPMPVKV